MWKLPPLPARYATEHKYNNDDMSFSFIYYILFDGGQSSIHHIYKTPSGF